MRLIDRQGRILIVEGVDMYDDTPLLDIKPYMEHGCARRDGSHTPR